MMAQYLSVRWREPLALCGFFASIILSMLSCIMPICFYMSNGFFIVTLSNSFQPRGECPNGAGRVSGHIHFFMRAQVRAMLADQHRLGHFEELLYPAFFNIPVFGVTNLDYKQC